MRELLIAFALVLAPTTVSAQEAMQQASGAAQAAPAPARPDYLRCLSLMQMALQHGMMATSRGEQIQFMKDRVAALECNVALHKRISDDAEIDRFRKLEAVFRVAADVPTPLATMEYQNSAMLFMNSLPQ